MSVMTGARTLAGSLLNPLAQKPPGVSAELFGGPPPPLTTQSIRCAIVMRIASFDLNITDHNALRDCRGAPTRLRAVRVGDMSHQVMDHISNPTHNPLWTRGMAINKINSHL